MKSERARSVIAPADQVLAKRFGNVAGNGPVSAQYISTLNGGVARLSDGTIAGAALSVYDTLLNLISMGIAKENAILSATSVPAKVIGNQNIGEIEAGRFADFIVCDAKLNRRSVFLGGLQIS